MAKYTFEVGDVVVLVGAEGIALTVIEVDPRESVAARKVTVGWFSAGDEFRSTSLPVAVLRSMMEEPAT